MKRYIEHLSQGSLLLIKFDDDVKKIKDVDIRSKEEFELECILFLDEYKRNYAVDYIIYTKNDEVIFKYDNKEEIKNIIR